MKSKIVVAITGHRDMIETEEINQKVSHFFKELIEENREIVLLSPLADGADRFVARIFLDLKNRYQKLSLIVPMPFDRNRYMEDFSNSSKDEFLKLLDKSDEVFEVEHITASGYLDVGRYVVDSSNILLALWDGTYNGKIGGTGDVVEYAKSNEKEVVHFLCKREG